VETLARPQVRVARPLHAPVHGEVGLADGGKDGRLATPADLAPLLDQGDEALVLGGRLLNGEGAEALRLVVGLADQGLRISHGTHSSGDGWTRPIWFRTGIGAR